MFFSLYLISIHLHLFLVFLLFSCSFLFLYINSPFPTHAFHSYTVILFILLLSSSCLLAWTIAPTKSYAYSNKKEKKKHRWNMLTTQGSLRAIKVKLRLRWLKDESLFLWKLILYDISLQNINYSVCMKG